MQLNPELILTTAFEILDEYGLGDLSMRRLARTLEVAPGALYWHYPSKQALLGAVADQILGAPDGTDPTDPTPDVAWQDRTRASAAALLDRLLSTRDGAEIVSAALATGTLSRNPVDPVVAALSGSPAADPELVGWVLVRYLLGAATELQTAGTVDPDASPAAPADIARILAGVDLILTGASMVGPRELENDEC
ncbi:TetR family transcriptional regulator [Corynebacterium terpenotabidum]|uniref:TetR family transcriptional regulator n=1 Tax=Corynebacterium terpenotabidum Y-11 TaxID=1200352 RepID=S4XG29_9CORY|nr:TetR family transcriptional regulator [Corynebacterium terpenotabidum]AGP30615.1 TetR family transcriptional regulator [Corynebacterium terpenotabidum Y-11]